VHHIQHAWAFLNSNFFKTLVMVMVVVVAVVVGVHLPCLLKPNVCQIRLHVNHKQCSEVAELLESCTHLILMLANLMQGWAFPCL